MSLDEFCKKATILHNEKKRNAEQEKEGNAVKGANDERVTNF